VGCGSTMSPSRVGSSATPPELQRRLTRQLKPTCDSWHVVETYIRIKGKRRYLYRGPKKGSVKNGAKLRAVWDDFDGDVF